MVHSASNAQAFMGECSPGSHGHDMSNMDSSRPASAASRGRGGCIAWRGAGAVYRDAAQKQQIDAGCGQALAGRCVTCVGAGATHAGGVSGHRDHRAREGAARHYAPFLYY